MCWNVAGRMDIDISFVEDCRRLAKQCKMADLIEELQNKCKQVYEFGKTAHLVHIPLFWTSPTWWMFVCFFILLFPHTEVSNKPGVCVKVLSLEPRSCQLQEDMAQLAHCALPIQLRVSTWRLNTNFHYSSHHRGFKEPISVFFCWFSPGWIWWTSL